MSSAVLHYIYDPLCGWCYGAAPLVAAARDIVSVRAHGGGMAGSNRRQVSPQLRNFVAPHDRRIAEVSGQAFGERYTNGLLLDSSAVFDSEPPISAVLAADQLASRGLDMLSRLQLAHFVEGQRIADRPVLAALAKELGLGTRDFLRVLEQIEGEATQLHIRNSRALLQRLGTQGFPTFALEQDGRFHHIDIGDHLGHPEQWQAWLRTQVPANTAPLPAGSPFTSCSPDGCDNRTTLQQHGRGEAPGR
jgi:putative protein-disulfide isomerase